MIGPTTALVALLGHPVDHSLSPAMQNAAFRHEGIDARYLAFDVPPGRLGVALEGLAALGALGANVTVPHKEEAFALCDDVEPRARSLGAVNVVLFRDGRLEGYNSDIDGVEGALDLLPRKGTRALLLGAGGSARAAAVALLSRGASVLFVANRSPERAVRLADDVALSLGRRAIVVVDWRDFHESTFDVVVNATSLGLEGNAWPGDDLRRLLRSLKGAPLLDLVYSRRGKTELVEGALAEGLLAVGGEEVLLRQGARAFSLFTGRSAPLEVMRRALEEGR
ncbi:shikimate dehydrogenase [Aminithiophilus ramosus]|uniref:Shikimate dehydrogenase (NADP(+)) n=1 Tax=Aminithiophilus ramosus TaxID=3029084 RepID=A0A9Q7EV81_9BACT|nr:shikimate dehydrogenase [Aminithiophilus ramosus]QTX31794.1 shikimate dehydrogenase [Aminithiophilus ramosus]